MMRTEKQRYGKCCLCNNRIQIEQSHNANPLINGRCCSTCNHLVIIFRMHLATQIIDRTTKSPEELNQETDEIREIFLNNIFNGEEE